MNLGLVTSSDKAQGQHGHLWDKELMALLKTHLTLMNQPIIGEADLKAARNGYREQGRINSNNANLEVLNDLEERFGPNTTIGQAKSKLKMYNGQAGGRITQAARRIYDKPTGF